MFESLVSASLHTINEDSVVAPDDASSVSQDFVSMELSQSTGEWSAAFGGRPMTGSAPLTPIPGQRQHPLHSGTFKSLHQQQQQQQSQEHSQGHHLIEASKPHRLSSEVGRVRGVPNPGQFGSLPIRYNVTPTQDSGQHLLYLRIVTPDDPPDARPYSLLKISLDQKAEVERIKEAHKSDLYLKV